MSIFMKAKVNESHYYKIIRDQREFSDIKSSIEQMWKDGGEYLDKDFPDLLKVDFWPRYLELLYVNELLAKKIQLLKRDAYPHKGKKGGPDLCVINDEQKLWIEVACPSEGTGVNAVPSATEGKHEVYEGTRFINLDSPSDIEDKAILRYGQVIFGKFEKYLKSYVGHICAPDEPFIIATGNCGLPWLSTTNYPYPSALKAVLGKRLAQINLKTKEVSLTLHENIEKISESGIPQEIPTDLFVNEKYADKISPLSGILHIDYSPFRLSSNETPISFIHNPNSKNKVDERLFEFCEQFAIHGDNLKIQKPNL